jgi:hypothetical protein
MTTRFLALILLLLALGPQCLAGGPFELLTGQVLGFREANQRYSLGQDAKLALARFGPAERIKDDNYDGFNANTFTRDEYSKQYLAYTRSSIYVNDGITITEGKDGRIRGILFNILATKEMAAAPVKTDSGISVGASLRDVYRAHGTPFKTTESDVMGYHALEVFYRRVDNVFSFQFRDGKLATIGVFAEYLPFLQQ